MNPEQPDLQRALADLDARLGHITAEVAEVRAGLIALGRHAGPAQAPQAARPGSPWQPPGRPAPEPPAPEPPAPVPPAPVPPAHGVRPGRPWQPPAREHAWQSAPPQQPWAPPAEARPPRAPRVTVATVIAAIGGSVMLAGIAFLLVVAIQAGLFPPIARVIGAAALAVVLIVLGLRLQARHEPTAEAPVNPGALALVGTGLAAAMLDVIAATTLYLWIPVPAAFMFVGGLALGGVALAQRWGSGLLACLVSAGTMLLAPFISTDVELPVFVAIVGIATAALAADLGVAVRVAWSVLPGVLLAGYLSQAALHSRGEQIALIATALVFATVGTGVAWYDSLRRSPAVENAALVVVPTALPLALLPATYLLRPGWPYGLLLAAAYLLVAGRAGRTGTNHTVHTGHTDRDRPATHLSAVTGIVGSALLLLTWVELGGREMTGFALTLSALTYVAAAGVWGRRWLHWVAGAASVLALLVYLGVNEPHLALSERLAVREFSYWDVVSALAATALAAAVTWWVRRRLPREAGRVTMVGAVVALATFSVMIVAAGVTIGDLAGAARTGFLAAHLVVTVLWICCAAWLVLTPSPRIADARRLGFVLGALALAKLLLLDLATLPGLFRVLSFIAVGAVMLAVAVRYRKETDPSGSGSPT
ncbi:MULTISPECIES: DUF2339 domain-containing protein [Dietzia]|uniref:DUF2339 domain-containing protein n=1 Tax=Dietzia TaxID=37914 RepID=UPI000D0870D9|nr:MULTISPECIES: DUF2339 domain-containing protein [Dietzia]AVM64346.1 hypothetical protein C3V38_08010 [Dietzia sp. oral taxon 368]MCT2274975.1 DUF2339 domain-containing protein [Dietzia cinnamea]